MVFQTSSLRLPYVKTFAAGRGVNHAGRIGWRAGLKPDLRGDVAAGEAADHGSGGCGCAGLAQCGRKGLPEPHERDPAAGNAGAAGGRAAARPPPPPPPGIRPTLGK
jgi:hypothetical protein